MGERPSLTFARRNSVGFSAEIPALDFLRKILEPKPLSAPSFILLRLRDMCVSRVLDSSSMAFRFFVAACPDSRSEARSEALRLIAEVEVEVEVDVDVKTLFFLSVTCNSFQLLERLVKSISK